MRRFIFALAVLIAISGCSKKTDSETGKIDGKWNVVSITENANSRILLPPAGLATAPFLSFSDGNFSGASPANQIGEGEFTLVDSAGIRFKGFSSTQVGEGEFGKAMFEVLMSCQIQSLAPCTPAQITWDGTDRISINGRFRYTLNMERD